MEWIARHSDSVSALASLGTLAVWVVYLQVFVNSYRRQLRATLHITRGPGAALDARCLLTNMSSGPVFIASVQVQIELEGDPLVSPVTDKLYDDSSVSREAIERTRQGPLESGETRDLGPFADLVREASFNAAGEASPNEERLRSVMVEVVGLYGSEDLPVGARRHFMIDSERRLHGNELRTTQIRNRRDRLMLLNELGRDR